MNFLSNTLINGVTSKDAKFFHVTTLGCNNLTFLNFHVSAPKTSINTDGIHIGRSTRVNITDTIIVTGDDCISIGDGSQQVYIKRVICENTHGISVGSLGRYSFEQPVSGIYVKNCTISNAMTGLRVKTWPASPVAMSASEIHYQDIILNNVGTPILIDQEYCPNNQCSMQTPSLVQLSHVSFDNIQGTSSTHLAVKLVCSGSHPCQDVRVGNIHLTYTGPEGPATSLCSNVKPIFSGVQIPALCVSSAQAS
ncbi:galacturonan 1,4-alpha-galacturonidase [Sarracenia purpurea var. burkii]